ncbi:hypothetical protein O6H91_06G084300 [Diphasiastrum complanatum]|uniref:Uncharacterized protein n=1 Tax=Diphasiastrum complanatum TaxID=34168 RepID=A0ACC2DG74_DIPCM|nr:hypothetical protein O6H91_06G084300 [Diphasiastrum complanatum]
MVARSGCEVVMPSHMEQEITAAVEEELAALVARYLEKRGLKRTLTRFLKEARLVNRLENSKEDLEEIYTSYMSGIKSASCKKKKAKQDLLEPSQKKAKLVTRTSSVDNQSVADKTDGKNGNEVDSVEGDRSALQTIAGKMKSLLAVNSDTVTQEASKLKKKSRKAKAPGIGSISPQDLCSLVDERRACLFAEGVSDSVESVGKGRPFGNDPALDDEHVLIGKAQKTSKMKVEEVSITVNTDARDNRKHATVNKASQNLACSGRHLGEPCCGIGASTKSECSNKKKESLVEKKKNKRSAERVKSSMELSTEQKIIQLSIDNDSKFKKQQLQAEKAPSSLKIPLSSYKSLNGIPTLDAALDSNVLLETSKKKNEFDFDAGKSGMVEVKSFDGQHSEGPPLVITQLDNGSEDCIRKSKQPEAIGVRAFQRVKLDEVTFADPRLQNNSYWAKDGAEMGWGAKAEEVLGQVKGRDFRHEKTKKKRGSYKGGAIDLHSRSIKFSYSDEE